MDEEFEQKYYSRTAKTTYRTSHDSIGLNEWHFMIDIRKIKNILI